MFMWSAAALFRKVFIFVFDFIDAVFERRGAALTSTPFRGDSLRHTCGILQCQFHMQTKFTDKTHVLCFAVPTFTSAAQENEASSNSFAESAIPRCKPATRVGRFNYYAVRKEIQMWPTPSIGLILSVT
jgi:hypothetical protein